MVNIVTTPKEPSQVFLIEEALAASGVMGDARQSITIELTQAEWDALVLERPGIENQPTPMFNGFPVVVPSPE